MQDIKTTFAGGSGGFAIVVMMLARKFGGVDVPQEVIDSIVVLTLAFVGYLAKDRHPPVLQSAPPTPPGSKVERGNGVK